MLHLLNKQKYTILALEEKYTSLLNEASHLEKENDNLNLQIAMNQTTMQEEKIQNDQKETVPLIEYELLKEEYLKCYSIKQSNDYRNEEYERLRKVYRETKDDLSSIKYSFDELKKTYDNLSKESQDRIDLLNRDNDSIKEQLNGICNQYTLSQFKIRNMQAKQNKMKQRSNAVKMKIRSIEKANSSLKKRCTDLRIKLVKTKNESDNIIEKIKHCNEVLEEKNTQLTEENKNMSKNVFKEFIQEIEKETLKFHYISSDNLIEVLYDNEVIGQVKNMTSLYIKNHLNKAKDQEKYQFSNCSNRDKILLLNSLRKSCNNNQITLRQLYSPSSLNYSEEENKNDNLLNDCNRCYYNNNQMILTNSLKRAEINNINCLKEITPFNINILESETEEEKEKEGYSSIIVGICQESSFTLNSYKQPKANIEYSLMQSHQKIITNHISHYIDRYNSINCPQIQQKNSKNIFVQENHSANYCANCAIY